MSNSTSSNPTDVVTGKVRLSYVNLLEPKSINEGSDPKYSVSVIIPKSSTKTLDKVRKAIEAAKEQGKLSKFGGKIPKGLKLPLRDGDEERDEEAYEGAMFLNASTTIKPKIIDRTGKEMLELSSEDVYSGMYARLILRFYPFNSNGKKGVAVGLQGVQKIADGERLGGTIDVEKAFGAVPYEDEDDLI